MRRVGGQETKRYLLVDGNNLVHRAYYAHVESKLSRGEPILCTSDGFPTGVLYGSLSMLESWIRELGDLEVVAFFDGVPKRRKEIDPGYKAGRQADAGRGLRMSGETGAKVDRVLADGARVPGEVEALAHILPLLGCAVYHHPEEEADDLIASFCAQNPGAVRIIASSDKDFFQLLEDPRVACYVPGGTGNRLYDAERATQYWADLKSVKVAVRPSQVRMFKALCGDSSDSIPGVERLRKKAAITVCDLRTVEEVLATGLPAFSASEREKVIASADRVRMNLDLVTLRDRLDLAAALASPPRPDHELAARILQKDFEIFSVDAGAFRRGRPPADAVPPPLPVEDWLADV